MTIRLDKRHGRGGKRRLPMPGMDDKTEVVECTDGRKVVRQIKEDRSTRRTVAMAAMAVQGFTAKEIAQIMNVEPNTVEKALYRMRRRGRLVDSEDKLDHGIIPEAIEQLMLLVKGGDREAILAALKGRGFFKHHAAGGKETGVAVQTNLVVRFEVPGGGEKPALVGQVVGVARGGE